MSLLYIKSITIFCIYIFCSTKRKIEGQKPTTTVTQQQMSAEVPEEGSKQNDILTNTILHSWLTHFALCFLVVQLNTECVSFRITALYLKCLCY